MINIGVIGILKIEFFILFFGTERVKQNKKKLKSHSKLPNLSKSTTVSVISIKDKYLFIFH